MHASTSYNILLDPLSVNALGAIVSTPHVTMKFLSYQGSIIAIHENLKVAQDCYMASLKLAPMFEFDEFKAINMVSLVDMEDVETLDLDLRTKE